MNYNQIQGKWSIHLFTAAPDSDENTAPLFIVDELYSFGPTFSDFSQSRR